LSAVIAGKTGIGMSQRMKSFVVDKAENPFNVLEPGKRPRVTLTPTLALKDGKPYLCFSVQGGVVGQRVDFKHRCFLSFSWFTRSSFQSRWLGRGTDRRRYRRAELRVALPPGS
jgi:Gamma-glutamyltranspeptidase